MGRDSGIPRAGPVNNEFPGVPDRISEYGCTETDIVRLLTLHQHHGANNEKPAGNSPGRFTTGGSDAESSQPPVEDSGGVGWKGQA